MTCEVWSRIPSGMDIGVMVQAWAASQAWFRVIEEVGLVHQTLQSISDRLNETSQPDDGVESWSRQRGVLVMKESHDEVGIEGAWTN